MSQGSPESATRAVNLSEFTFPRLLFALLHRRFTGTMVVEQRAPSPGRRTVWIRGGMPVFTDWVEPSDVLGQVLTQLRLIDADAVNKALMTMAQSGGLLGEILLQQGALGEATLREGLRRQCARKLTHLFHLRDGIVTLAAGEHPVGRDDGLIGVNVLELILSGVTSAYDEGRAGAEMGEGWLGPIVTTPALARYRSHFRFRPDDGPALDALAAGSDAVKIGRLPGMSMRRAAQVIYGLWACQMLRTGEDAAAAIAELGAQPKAAARPAASRTPAAPAKPAAPRPSAKPRPAAKPTPARPSAKPTPARPSARPAAAADDDHAAFLAEVEAIEHKIADNAHAFDLMGVPVEATKRDIRRAWTDLSRKFHPDALKSKGLDHLRDRVEQVFASLSEAHLKLGDAESRDELRTLIEMGGEDSSEQSAVAFARAALEAEVHARDADKLLKAGRFDRAKVLYQKAIELNPKEPDVQVALAWCDYQITAGHPGAADQTVALLERLLKDHPNIARGHYFLGMVLKDMGNIREAVDEFDAAIAADPRLVDAERQARAIRIRSSRRTTADKEGGLFGIKGLFSKK